MKNKTVRLRTFVIVVVLLVASLLGSNILLMRLAYKKGGSEAYEEAFRAGAFAGFKMGLETGRKCGKECEGFASVPFIIPE